jgi:phosphoserine phosphatase
MAPAVLLLLADPAHPVLSEAVVAPLARALDGPARWLAPDIACELATTRADAATIAAATLGDLPVDRVVLPAGDRLKRLLVSDMDSTIITVECIDEIADFAGVKSAVADITRRAMNGELDFAAALRARAALLEGLPETVLEQVMTERVRLTPGARTLVTTLRARGATTALVSGGFTFFTQRVAALCGFDVHEANVLEARDGRLTGRVLEPIRGADAKLATFERLRVSKGLSAEACAAVGDGANDLPMLRAAGLGVGYRAHPSVAAEVTNLRHTDLTGVLYLMGIRRAAFTTLG